MRFFEFKASPGSGSMEPKREMSFREKKTHL